METTPDWVLRQLREVPGLSVRKVGTDKIELQHGRQRGATLRVRPHSRLGPREVEWLLSQPRLRETLLATRCLSPSARDVLARAHLSWVERETGLIHLDADQIFVHVERDGLPVERNKPETPLLYGGTTSVLVEVLLEDYRRRRFTLREIAERVNVTKGRVSQVFSQWLAAGILEAEGRTRSREYELRDPGRLLDDWAASGSIAPELATGLFAWSRTPADLYKRLRELDSAEISWAIGGVTAAQAYAPTLSAVPAPDVWVAASVPAEHVAAALDAEVVGRDESPNMMMWQTGGDPALVLASRRDAPGLQQRSLPLVSRPRAYAEARAAGGRGVDVAEAVREEIGL